MSLLLFHGMVQVKHAVFQLQNNTVEEIMRQNKKIIVVLNPSIQDNFKKNIFNKQLSKFRKIQVQGMKIVNVFVINT